MSHRDGIMSIRSMVLAILLALILVTPLPLAMASNGSVIGSSLVKIYASADAVIGGPHPDTNYGGYHNMTVGTLKYKIGTYVFITFTYRSVLFFDLSQIPPGSQISKARLYLTVKYPPRLSADVRVHALAKPFMESYVTWHQRVPGHNWTNPGGDYYSTVIDSKSVSFDAHEGTKLVFDVTTFVRDVVSGSKKNYGFLLDSSATNDTVTLYTKEGAAAKGYNSWKPYLTVEFQPPTIQLVASQESVEVAQGSSVDVQLQVGGTFTGQSSLSYEWVGTAPSGIDINFDPEGGTVPFASTLRIAADQSAPPGTYRLKVKASNTTYHLGDDITLNLMISSSVEPDFSLALNPDTLSVTQGEEATFTVSVSPIGGFDITTIRFSVSGVPPFSTPQFIASGGTIYLKIRTTSSTPPGSYPIIVRGESGGKSHTDTATLIVAPIATTTSSAPATSSPSTTTQTVQGKFLIRGVPSTLRVPQGSQASFNVTVTGFYGFSSPVTLGVSGLPTGITISSNLNNIPPNFTATIVVQAADNAPLGTYSLTLIATGGGLTRSSSFKLEVVPKLQTTGTAATTQAAQPGGFDFSITVTPAALTINTGSSGSVAVTVKRLSGSGTVKLSASGLPPDATFKFNPEVVTPDATSSLIINAGSSTGTFTIVVTGTSDSLVKTATFTLNVTAGESRCIIATAAYGSELDPHVSMLRSFRDHVVMRTYAGSRFMTVFNAFYYSWSPYVADIIRGSDILASIVRGSIMPLLFSLNVGKSLNNVLWSINQELAIVFIGLLVSSLLGLIYLTPILLLIHRKRVIPIRVLKVLIISLIIGLIMITASEILLLDSLAQLSTAIIVLSTIFLAPIAFTRVLAEIGGFSGEK